MGEVAFRPDEINFQPGGVVVVGSGDSSKNFSELSNQLIKTQSKLESMSFNLNKAVADGARETIDKLDVALSKTFDIAVFIRGDYDHRDVDESQMQEVLHQSVLAFEDTQERAMESLKTIADFHAQVMEIQNTEISKAKDDIKLMIESNTNELVFIGSELHDTEKAVSIMQQSLVSQTQAVISLQSKVTVSEVSATASDLVFTISTFGIGNSMNHGPLDPLELHKELDEARRNRDEAQQNLGRALSQLDRLESQKMGLQLQLSNQRSLQNGLPQLQSTAASVESRSVMLQSQFGLLKDTSSKLVLKAQQVQSDAAIAEKTVLSKKEFGVSLLQICSDALIDSQLCREVQNIKDDIFNEWGGDMPQEIEEAGKEVANKLEFVRNIPSIKERL